MQAEHVPSFLYAHPLLPPPCVALSLGNICLGISVEREKTALPPSTAMQALLQSWTALAGAASDLAVAAASEDGHRLGGLPGQGGVTG